MTTLKRKDRTKEGLKFQQLLAFIQGPAGAGKTYAARKFGEQLGVKVMMTGTTHNAAREVHGYTINELLGLKKKLPLYA